MPPPPHPPLLSPPPSILNPTPGGEDQPVSHLSLRHRHWYRPHLAPKQVVLAWWSRRRGHVVRDAMHLLWYRSVYFITQVEALLCFGKTPWVHIGTQYTWMPSFRWYWARLCFGAFVPHYRGRSTSVLRRLSTPLLSCSRLYFCIRTDFKSCFFQQSTGIRCSYFSIRTDFKSCLTSSSHVFEVIVSSHREDADAPFLHTLLAS